MPSRARSVHPPAQERPRNRLLAGLPDSDFERVRPHLRTVPTVPRQMFHGLHEPIRDVVFLNGGIASITTTMRDGSTFEVATVGAEGMLGVDAFLGDHRSSNTAMMQVPDTSAELMPVAAFRTEMFRRGALHEGVQRFTLGLLGLMAQSAACIAAHDVQARCCRWLLMTRYRLRRDEFQLSQESLAMMLGATRPTVSVVAGTLQKAGLIAYKHGHIGILDPAGLEAASCECYEAVKAHFERLGL